jgi:hypothetical protein
MALSVPRYIEQARIEEVTVRFLWDDWNVEAAESPIDKKLKARLKKLSLRANVAFAIATAEWVVFRFESLLDDLLPLEYLEAAWTQSINFTYGFIWWEPLHDDEWVGPIKGPIRETIAWVMSIIRVVEEDEERPAEMCASVSKLGEFVLTDPAPYKAWRERILTRLEQWYRYNPADPLGDVVPREAFDPDFPFQPDRTESLINQFLAGLDPEENEFLKTAEDLLEEGFEGTPYSFDIEKDRHAHRDIGMEELEDSEDEDEEE